MSRSASKSRADKVGRRSSVLATTPQPTQQPDVVVEEIIPGRLTQAQWLDMLEQDDADEVVKEIMDGLLSHVMERCLEGYIQRQLGSFSVSWARDHLVQVLEWQFLYQDKGDGLEEASRTEDSEPPPATIDSWAEGCVPVIHATSPSDPTPTPQQETLTSKAAGRTEPGANQQHQMMAQQSSSPKQPRQDRKHRQPPDYWSYKALSPIPPPKSKREKGKQINTSPATKTYRSRQSPKHSLSSSVEKEDDKEFEEEKKRASPSTHRGTFLYQREDYQTIPRLNRAHLPQLYVLPQYEILDTIHTKPHANRHSGPPVPKQTHDKQHSAWTVHTLTPFTNHQDQPTTLQRRHALSDTALLLPPRNTPSPAVGKRKGIIPFSGTLRLDTMELVAGVSLKDAQDVRLSPLKVCAPGPLKHNAELRPIRGSPAGPLLSVEQLTAGPPPQVTPLH